MINRGHIIVHIYIHLWIGRNICLLCTSQCLLYYLYIIQEPVAAFKAACITAATNNCLKNCPPTRDTTLLCYILPLTRRSYWPWFLVYDNYLMRQFLFQLLYEPPCPLAVGRLTGLSVIIPIGAGSYTSMLLIREIFPTLNAQNFQTWLNTQRFKGT